MRVRSDCASTSHDQAAPRRGFAQSHRRGDAGRGIDRALRPRYRARAGNRDLRPGRAESVCAGGRRQRAVHAAHRHHRQPADVRHPPRGRHARGRASVVADAVPANRERLFHDLRQLLRGDPHRDAGQDRGHRHGPPRHSRRRLAHAAGALEGQGADRFRDRPPAVHADLRAALEGLAHDPKKWAPVFGSGHAQDKRAHDPEKCEAVFRTGHAQDKRAHDPEKCEAVFRTGHAQDKRSLMDAPPRARNPQAVLFACGQNSVRSPMAASLLQHMFPHALYVKSAGVKKGELDPFAVAVMAELGQDISTHKPTTFEELEDWEGLNFDLIITLSPEAHHKALDLTRTLAAEVEYWPTRDPTGTEGNREQKLQAYREVCDTLLLRIRKRFSKVAAASG